MEILDDLQCFWSFVAENPATKYTQNYQKQIQHLMA